MSLLIDTPLEITAEWLTAVLRKGGVLSLDGVVEAADTRPIGTGQMGVVLRSVLTYGGAAQRAPASVIVKLPSQDPGSRAYCLRINAYEVEVRFYQELAQWVQIDVPQAIWSEFEPGSGRASLLLEDLSAEWVVGNSIAGGTVRQASVALDQLVRLQAPLWNDARLSQYAWLDARERVQWLFDSVPPAVPAFSERFAQRIDPRHFALVQKLGPRASRLAPMLCRPPLVIGHADFRLDNIFFSTTPGPLRAKTADWQSARLSAPLLDVSIYLNTCLSTRDRRNNFLRLLKDYHGKLLSAGVRGFSFEDCLTNYRLCSLNTFLLCISTALSLEQTERGDDMFAKIFSTCAFAVEDLDSAQFLD